MSLLRQSTQLLAEAIRGNAVPLGLAAAVVAGGYIAGIAAGQPGLMRDLWYPETFRLLLALLWFPLTIAFPLRRLRTRDTSGVYIPGLRGWVEAWRRFRADYFSAAPLLRALLAGGAVCLIINTYGSWKRVIPTVSPFPWDEPLARLDRLVHFGLDPWRLLFPILGSHSATVAIDLFYATWHPLLAAVVTWMAFSRDRHFRNRFFMGMVFVWIGLGGVLATLLSSAGPGYYAHVAAGPDPFAPLMAFLREVHAGWPLQAILGQDTLWRAFEQGTATPYTGISAMPSLHVAMPALYTAACWSRWRRLGWAFAAYTLLTLVGSVHLGWHYAVDGYLSIMAVALWWKVSDRRWQLSGDGA